MDRALWLLLWLRCKAWARRLGRSVRTVRGALLVGVGLSLLLLWVVPALLTGAPVGGRGAEVRQYGPWALLAFCVMNLLLSTNENALTFNAAEVNFLFPAPLSRRQLLLYKVWGVVGQSVLSGLFFTLFMRQYASLTVAAIVGLILTILMLQLFAMLLALLASVLGARAYNRRRKLVIGLVAVAIAAAAFQAFGGVWRGDWRSAVDELDRSPVVGVLLAPARWFVGAFSAEQLWPDLVQWAALALAVDGVLLLLLFALDAHYLEAAAVASERRYAQAQQVRRGGVVMMGVPGTRRLRFTAPALPYLGGVGPVLWRQATTFLRSWWSLLLVLLLTAILSVPLLARAGAAGGVEQTAPMMIGMLASMTLVIPTLLPFDFRGDVDRMDVLKVLPVPAWALVVGQLLTPVAVVTLAQLLVMALAYFTGGRDEPWLLAACAFLPPVNFLLFAIENLLFLWFPHRLVATTPGDFQVLGRQVILWLAKFVGLTLMLGLAFAAGLASFLATGNNWVVAGVAAWVACTVLAGAVVPLVASAFRRFDVSRDTPA